MWGSTPFPADRIRRVSPHVPASTERWEESKWPPFVAIVVAAVLYMLLPGSLILGGGFLRWLVPALEIVMLVIVFSPPVYESERRRHLILAVVGIATLANASAIVLLVHGITTEKGFEGKSLMGAALAVWVTNIIIFALWFWEMDGNGPRRRAREAAGPHDFLYAQYTMPEPWTWRPAFLDYLFMSTTNSASFAPADTLPLTGRAKAVMALQSVLSLAIVIVVLSRAISILH